MFSRMLFAWLMCGMAQWKVLVVSPNRIGGSNDRAAGRKGADNARLCHRHNLLLHDVKEDAVVGRSLVELVNEAGALVGEDKRTGFDRVFAAAATLVVDDCRQTACR